jgi:hypothetical protein
MSDVNILHHISLIESDMDATIRRYEQIGFIFTPLSMPRIILKPGGEPETLGVGNRTAIFQMNYLEVLAVVDKERWGKIPKAQRGPYDIDPHIQRYEGLHVMHFGTDNLEAVKARLSKQETPSSDIRPFQRPVDTPEGPRMMHAKSIYFPEDKNPEALIQIAQHLTPELIFQDRYMHHPNGAQTITEIIVCAENPLPYAEKYFKYTSCKNEQRDDFQVVDLGYSRILIVSPEKIMKLIPNFAPTTLPYLAGFTVAVQDLETPRKVLSENKVPLIENEGRLIVLPKDACGSAVLFEIQCAKR